MIVPVRATGDSSIRQSVWLAFGVAACSSRFHAFHVFHAEKTASECPTGVQSPCETRAKRFACTWIVPHTMDR